MSLKQPDYNRFSKYYDLIELGGGEGPVSLKLLEKILRKNKVKTVLDFTCGTGAQSIPLSEKGYIVTAADLNKKMLEIARKKAKDRGLEIDFYQRDIRKSRIGKFDAVISMFNSIGHLSKKEFEEALMNVGLNLKKSGIFVFDIFNLEYMIDGGFVDHKFIDMAMEKDGVRFVRFNKNALNFKSGLMTVDQETYIQKDMRKPDYCREKWEMQLYTKEWLRRALEKHRFGNIKFLDTGQKINGHGLFIFAVAERM